MLRFPDGVEPPRLHGLHAGTVLDVGADGELQVTVPAVFDETTPAAAVWARPCLPYGVFFLPEKGQTVWLGFENGDPAAPVWLGVWHPAGTAPDRAKKSPPKHRVISTPAGHVVEFDDEGKTLVVEDASGNRLEMAPGGVTLTCPKGLTIDAAGQTVQITASLVDVKKG